MTNFTVIQNQDLNLKISDGAFKLYVLLKSMCYGKKDTCFPSQQYLATQLNKSTRTIQRYLNELIQNKLIKKKRRGSISNVYKIVGKKVLQAVNTAVNQAKKAYTTYCNNNSNNELTQFNDYPQREYDYNKLEELLLYGKGSLSECQI